ncbi:MAG TPA: hypothetical protein VFB33_02145 [Candidatus Binataceae bacterium]|nr:hypothetical protein [Candidatus Binataceae bacterium]
MFALFAAALLAGGVGFADTQVAVSAEPQMFKILSSDGQQVLGHAVYHVRPAPDGAVVIGENRYLDGERDVEHDVIKIPTSGELPTLVRFERAFFNADGSRKYASRADLGAGSAVCISYENGRERTMNRRMEFAPDTYAGASAVVALEHALRRGIRAMGFHFFDCAPGPTVVAVTADPPAEGRSWRFYPSSRLAQVDVTAELGWLGSLVEGLVPHRDVWFDRGPNGGWEYVGGTVQRYFAGGPQVLLVREAAAH